LVLLATPVLGELPKVAIVDPVSDRELLQGLHRGDDLALLLVRQAFPPLVELVGSLGSPTHREMIMSTL